MLLAVYSERFALIRIGKQIGCTDLEVKEFITVLYHCSFRSSFMTYKSFVCECTLFFYMHPSNNI